MEKISLEQFGAKIRTKYPQYLDLSNLEVANKVLQKYPQYAEHISDIPQKPSLLKRVGEGALSFVAPTVKAFGQSIAGAIGGNKNLDIIDEANMINIETENTLMKAIRDRESKGLDASKYRNQLIELTGRKPLDEQLKEANPLVDKTAGQVLGEAGGTALSALSGGSFKGFTGASRIAPTAEASLLNKANFLSKPLSGRLAQIGKETAKDIGQTLPFGYGYDVTEKLANKEENPFKPGAGTIMSVLIPGGIGAVRAGRQSIASGLTSIASKASNVPEEAFVRGRMGIDPNATRETVLDKARASASAFKRTMQEEFGKGKEEIINEFTGKRIGLEPSEASQLRIIAKEFGFDDRIPKEIENMSPKEVFELLEEINSIPPIKEIDSPLVRNLKLSLANIKGLIKEKAESKEMLGEKFSNLYEVYSRKATMLRNIQSVINKVGIKPGSIKLTPVQETTAKNRLMKVFEGDYDSYLKAIKQLEDETGTNILDSVASALLNQKGAKVVSGMPNGTVERIISLLTYPISSPKWASRIINFIGGYGETFTQRLLKANPRVREAIYNAVNKDNMSFDNAVKVYAQDIIQEIKNNPNAGFIKNPLAGNAYKGEKDITTKFLDYAKGKTTLSRQEILDFARRPELKKGEADLLNNLAKDLPEGKLPAQDFADSIRRDLLELKPVKVSQPQYSSVQIDNSRNTPFGQADSEYYKKRGKNYEEVVFESPITTNGSSHFPNSKNYFAHARGDEVVEGGKKIWREQEIQSDIAQKGNLDKKIENIQQMIGGADERRQAYLTGRTGSYTKIEDLQKEIDNLKKLDPFTNDRFGERIMRERIREKAQKGYSKYRLPTGETIGKIEGFENPSWMIESGINRGKLLTKDNLKIGDEVMSGDVVQNNNQWIITDILGDGRFKAVPKDFADKLKDFDEASKMRLERGIDTPEASERLRRQLQPAEETFDLTGKSNPQYRRYEQWGKFLKNKFGGKLVTDPQGNTWVEVDIKKEWAKMPVEAFALFGLPSIKDLFKKKKENQIDEQTTEPTPKTEKEKQYEIANKAGIDNEFLDAWITKESSGDASAVGDTDLSDTAHGLLQVRQIAVDDVNRYYETFKGKKFTDKRPVEMTPEENISLAIAYIQEVIPARLRQHAKNRNLNYTPSKEDIFNSYNMGPSTYFNQYILKNKKWSYYKSIKEIQDELFNK